MNHNYLAKSIGHSPKLLTVFKDYTLSGKKKSGEKKVGEKLSRGKI